MARYMKKLSDSPYIAPLSRSYRRGSCDNEKSPQIKIHSRFDRPRNTSHRARNTSGSRVPEEILSSEASKLFKARCADLGIPAIALQEQKFIEACNSHFQNRRCQLRDLGLGQQSAKCLGKILVDKFWLVDLSQNNLGDSGCKSVAKALLKSKTLVHLSLSNNDLSAEGGYSVIKVLKNHPSMVSLDIGQRKNRLGQQGAEALKALLAENKVLTHLNVENTSLGDRGVDLLMEGLASNSSLLCLDISSNGITSIKEFGSVLVNCHLEELKLADNRLGNHGAEDISLLILGAYENPCYISSFDLSRNEVSRKGADKLWDALRGNSIVSNLKLDGNCFKKGLSQDFIACMEQNYGLKHLSLASCQLGDQLHSIADGLTANHGIISLNLSKNGITDAGVELLAEGLVKNETLKHLNLSFNTIKDQGGVRLAVLLTENSVLETLNLKENEMENRAGESFVEHCRTNSTLLVLNLAGNMVKPSHISEIDAMLRKNFTKHNQDLVPKLKKKIEVLVTEPGRKRTFEHKMKRIEQAKSLFETSVDTNLRRYEEVKVVEVKKTESVKKDLLEVKGQFLEVSRSFSDLQESLKVSEVHNRKGVQDWLDKIARMSYEIKVTEKKKSELKEKYALRRAHIDKELEGDREKLEYVNIGLRSANNKLEREKERLRQLRELKEKEKNKRKDNFFLASEKLANAKRVEVRRKSLVSK